MSSISQSISSPSLSGRRLPSNIDMLQKLKQIKIKDETYDELKQLGKMQETSDDVIRRILEHYKRTAKR